MRSHKRRQLVVAFVSGALIMGKAYGEDGLTITVPDKSSTIPRQEGAGGGLKSAKGQANLTRSVSLFLTDLINEYRLDKQTRAALREQMPEIADLLRRSGANGVLVEARFAADTNALRAGDAVGPKNMTQHLLGNRLAVVGQGSQPNEVATLALLDEKKNGSLKPGAPGRDETVVTSATRTFWIPRTGKVEDIDHHKLYSEAYLKANDQAYTEVKASFL